MKTILKRVAAVVLALAVAVTAAVFDVPEKITAEAATVGGCSGHSGMTVWTGEAFTASGSYYLTNNVDLTSQIEIGSGVDVTLCLNGHTITAASNKRIFNINGGSLTLCDCKGGGKLTGGKANGKGGAVYVESGSFTMHGGTITDNMSNGYGGGGVYVDENAKFIMSGGTISSNTGNACYGGGVSVSSGGIFEMSGGTISGNTATYGGSGVSVNGSNAKFTMSGGTISGNTTDRTGGGVYLTNQGTFNMSGGTISGNTAITNGGGVYMGGGTFNMSGGTISGNKVSSGGGVYVNSGTFTINGEVNISGNTNTDDSSENNVYLNANITITIGNNFSTDSVIGVTTKTTPADCTEFANVTGACSDVSEGFTADNNSLSVVYYGGMVKLSGAHGTISHTEKKEAICTEDGNEEYWKCSTCNKYFSDSACKTETTLTAMTIAATGHKTTKTEAKAATCTENGNKEYWYCSTCKKYFSNSTCTTGTTLAATVISKMGHKTTKTEAKAATCTADGNKEYWYCSTCKKYFSDSACTTVITKDSTVITKLGHSYSSAWTTDATYHWHACSNGCGTKSGNGTHSFEQKSDGTNHWQECSVCGYTNDKKTHTFTQNHDNTNHWQECACGYTKDETTHSLTYNADDTCRWQECDCGYVTGTTDHTFIRKYDETDHWYECETCQYKKSVTTHTLTAKKDESTHWQECGCGYKEGETSHVWSNWALTAEPTVNTTGTAERTCSCGEKQTQTDVPALTDASVWIKDETTKPTVDTEGEYTYTSDYGTVTVNDVPKLTDPSWTKTETKKPTIDKDGEYTYTSDYGTVTVEVPKLTDTVWTKTETKKPTMDETGEYTYTSDYGTVTETVPELSNTEVWTKDPENSIKPTEEQPGKDVYTSAYGTVEVPLDQLEHTHDWGAWTITADPTETGTGTAERSCTKDSEHKDTMELPALSDSAVWAKDNTQHVDPTEEGTGKDVYTSDYGTVTVTIPTLGHTLAHVPEVPATETTEGTKEHWHCEGCGKDFADENGETEITDLTMPVIGHTHNLTHVDEVPATETEDGVKEHWHCDGCGKDFADENGDTEMTETNLTIPVIGHTHNLTHVDEVPATETEDGVKEHWHCDGCGKDFADENGDTEMTETNLTIPVIGHTHNLTHVDEVPATETEDGVKEHWHCSDCGKDFADENGDTEMTETNLTIPVIGHTHNLTHVDEVPATETEDGVKEHWHCSVCGKDFADENGETEITGDELKIGKIEKMVQSGENAPAATLTTPNEELINAVLTSEDKAAVNDGKDIKIILTIDVQENVATEDKTAVETAIGGLTGYNLGQYLDVNLLKIIDGKKTNITETNAPLKITLEIPEALLGSGRTYSVIRVHNGETTVLEDKDDDPDTVTIETDKFSTYALAYSEKSNDIPPEESNSDSNDPTSSESEPTNSDDTSPSDDGSSDDETALPNDESSSTDESSTNSDDNTSSADDNNFKPSESTPSHNENNPSTGIVISFVPLAVAAAALTLAAKSKKK